MTKIKLDNVELDDIALSSNYQKIVYNKNNIEKILKVSTNKDIEVFLGQTNDTLVRDKHHIPATDELIEQVNLHISQENQHAKYYLAINLDREELVDTAYLAYLHYSHKRQIWKCDVIPLVNYNKIDSTERKSLTEALEEIKVDIYEAKQYYDTNIDSACSEQVIEYVKLKIKYPILHNDNYEQYQLKREEVKLAEPGNYAKVHIEPLEQLSVSTQLSKDNDSPSLAVNLKEFESKNILSEQDSSNTMEYNDQDTSALIF